MLDATRARNNIRKGLKYLGIKIDDEEFDKIWSVIIGAIFMELKNNGEVVDVNDPTAQIGTIK